MEGEKCETSLIPDATATWESRWFERFLDGNLLPYAFHSNLYEKRGLFMSFCHFVLLQNERIQCAPCKTKGSMEEVEYIYDIYDAEDHKSSLVCDS